MSSALFELLDEGSVSASLFVLTVCKNNFGSNVHHISCLTLSEVPIGKLNEFDIITTGAGKGEVRVNLISPSGRMFPARVEETIDGFAAKYTCYEPGPHKIAITFGGQPVPGSPFTVKAFPPKAPAPPKGDATKVKAYGPGLKGGIANTPADFTIDTRNAGPGGLGLTIEGPCEAKIECFDKGDGTCDVRYWPTEPGEYVINILFADKPIPGAPFKAQINPSKRVDVSNIKAYGLGIQPTGKKNLPRIGTRMLQRFRRSLCDIVFETPNKISFSFCHIFIVCFGHLHLQCMGILVIKQLPFYCRFFEKASVSSYCS